MFLKEIVYMMPISHPRVIGGFGGRGKVSQSIHKPFLQSSRKAFTKAFTKHSQEHSQSPHKSIHKVVKKTFTKLSQTLSREARRFFQGSPTGQNAELSRAQRGDFFRAAPTSQNAEEKKRREEEEEH